ncbi:MAG: hypothetical protein KC553_08720 [Nitrospina sp.]|nr:hypothetical protein [Nitrospina sp.]
MGQYNVLMAAEFHGFNPELVNERNQRLEEACFERIPTIEDAWEIAIEASDEAEAKNDAIEKFVNAIRTYPCELKLVVHAGESQILRRKKVFEP